MKEDETLTAEQVRGREMRKKLLVWQGIERQRVDRFVLVRVGEAKPKPLPLLQGESDD